MQDIVIRIPLRRLPSLGWLQRLRQAWTAQRQCSANRRLLREMDEQQLRDIGLSRGDIERCLDGHARWR